MVGVKTLEVPGYQIMHYLGNGAGSTIWQIRDRKTDEICALKRVVCRETSDKRFLQQVENEYEVASNLDHPVLRAIYSIQRLRKWLAVKEIRLVMECCAGNTLQEKRPTDVGEIVRIFREVADGLEHMHSRGFIHADMKPNNILRDDDGTIKVIDLGQSCRIGTVKDRIQGTPDFIAPEQVKRMPLDVRTDVFNFAAALYWTLTGRAIPTVLPPKGFATMKSKHQLIPPEEINPDVPVSLSKLIGDCVQYSPNNRPESIAEVRSRLNLVDITIQKKSDSQIVEALGEQDKPEYVSQRPKEPVVPVEDNSVAIEDFDFEEFIEAKGLDESGELQ